MPRPPRLPRFSFGLSLIPFKSRATKRGQRARGGMTLDVYACHVPSPRSTRSPNAKRATKYAPTTVHRFIDVPWTVPTVSDFLRVSPVWPTLLLQSGSEEDGKCSLRVSADGAQPRPPACRVCSASGCSFSRCIFVTIVDSTCVYVVTRGQIVGFIMLALQGLQAHRQEKS